MNSEKKKGEVRGGSEEKGGELRNKEGRSERGGVQEKRLVVNSEIKKGEVRGGVV